MKLGKVIFLHGASSSGKTTIAKLLQARLQEPFWHISIDHLRESGVLPLARYKSGEFDWKVDREPFFRGFHTSLRSYVDAGNNLIVEHIIETKEWKSYLAELFHGVDLFFVGIHCPLQELERREVQRKDRPLGDAQRDFERIHTFNTYDLELDSTLSGDQNAEELISAWKSRSGLSAFWLK